MGSCSYFLWMKINEDTVGKEEKQMATFTFDRPIVIRDEESKKRLEEFLNSDEPAKPISVPVFSDEERKKSEQLLAKYYFHSGR